MMKSYFCSIGTELASKIDNSSNPLLSGDYHINDKFGKFNFRTVNVQVVRDALAKAKYERALGRSKAEKCFKPISLFVYIVKLPIKSRERQ